MSGVMGRNLAAMAMMTLAGGLAVSTGGPAAQSMQQELRNANSNASSQPAKSDRGGPVARFEQALSSGHGFGSRGYARRRGPGWTQAHVKRIARKARNVAKNRRAHR